MDAVDAEFRTRFDTAIAKWQSLLQPLVDGIDEAERIDGDDLAKMIGPAPPAGKEE